MKRPTRFFNFQMAYEKYGELEDLSNQNDCSVAEIVRQAIDLFLKSLKDSQKQNDRGG